MPTSHVGRPYWRLSRRANDYVWVHNNDADESRKNETSGHAQHVDDMAGEQERITWGVFPMMGEDSPYVR